MGGWNPFSRGASAPRRPSGVTAGDRLFHGVSFAAAAVVLGVLGLIVVVLTQTSWLSFRTFGAGFLVANIWNPVAPQKFGAVPFVYGTLITAALAMLFGVPISLGIAIFLSELSPGWLREPLTTVVELLAAVPSVIYGLWGLYVLVPLMQGSVEPALSHTLGFLPIFSGPARGVDKLTASLVLTIMVIPTISAVSREALAAVPQAQREAALSLGATQWEATRLGVLRYARSGIFGAIILGLGRAVGETMAVTMTIGNRNVVTTSLLDQGQTIASQIASSFTGAIEPIEQSALIELGLVLMGISLLINAVARLFVGRVLKVEESAE